MQMKNNRFNHLAVNVGALWHLQNDGVRNGEFYSHSKSNEELDLFFTKRFYPEVYLWKTTNFKEFLFDFVKMFWIHKN